MRQTIRQWFALQKARKIQRLWQQGFIDGIAQRIFDDNSDESKAPKAVQEKRKVCQAYDAGYLWAMQSGIAITAMPHWVQAEQNDPTLTLELEGIL